MGFTKKGSVGEYIYGLIIGFVMFASAFGIIYLCSGFDSVATNAEISWGMIILLFLGYMIQGMSEEVLLRGYYMVSLATSCNVSTAIFASSCVFTLLHVGNEGINIVGLINVFLFGIFAALYFVRRGNIWGIAALHTMWNFAQGNIFGCLVSGNNSGKSVVTSQINDSLSLINGGKFGPEGGVAVAAVLVLGIMVLYFTKNKERTSEADYK